MLGVFQTSITNGPGGIQPWWVFEFNGTDSIYYRGSTNYVDLDYGPDSYGMCMNPVTRQMTHEFTMTGNCKITFPMDSAWGTKALNDTGDLYMKSLYPFDCSESLGDFPIKFSDSPTTSEWTVLAFGDCKVHHGDYPYCLLVRFRVEFAPINNGDVLCHTGQLMYQWIDTDTGKVVAFMLSHKQPGYQPYVAQFLGYSGNYYINDAIIGAWN